MTATVSADVRMYRLNELGDCFLVTFSAGRSTSRLLIDCGSFRNTGPSVARLRRIVGAIADDVRGSALDVVVGTHQHNDHVSGFVHCEPEFRKIGVDQVWLSWLDDPQDPMARELGEAHDNLKFHLTCVHRDLVAGSIRTGNVRSFEVLTDVLGFYGASAAGAPPVIPAKGIKILKELGSKAPLYLRPGRTLDMPGLPAGTVRVHVLGPPRIAGNELLRRRNPRAGETYDLSLAAANVSATKFLDAVNLRAGLVSRDEEQYPFGAHGKVRDTKKSSAAMAAMMQRYSRRNQTWRRIDDDWLSQAGALALYLDTVTNNSSLALAIELVDSGKVLLFPADAQAGNWLSWQDVKWDDPEISTDDLLARTVLYKVGHHASHNATLVAAFEKMNRPDLVALIPVHKQDPNITKRNGWKMPATNLFKRLTERTSNRVLQMDGDNPPWCDPARNPAKASWKNIDIKPRVTPLAVEITISG